MINWEVPASSFPIQWHVTIACDKNCKHCYTTDEETYKSELEKELSLDKVLKIGEKIIDFKSKYNVNVPLTITGGNPLLKKGLESLLKKLYNSGISVEILGNRRGLEKYINLFKEVDLEGYQISIDGNKKTHNYIRGEGSWKEVKFSIDYLKKNRIPVDVMTTVSNLNINQIKDISSYSVSKNVRRYSFDRIVSLGQAKLGNLFLPASNKYRNFLLQTFHHYSKLSNKNNTLLALKDQLWKPLMNELGIFNPRKTNKIIGGCNVGTTGLTILADGEVVPCRRLPITLGKLPEQSIGDIFFESAVMNELRNFEAIEECGECDLLSYCRGNRCVAYAQNEDYFSADPQCWRFK